MSRNRSKSAFFEGAVGHFERRFQREGFIAHHPLLVSEDWSDCRFVWYQNIRSYHLVLSQYTRLTDGQTDGQNCDSNTVRCITCSGTVNRVG